VNNVDGGRTTHMRSEHGWRVQASNATAQRNIDLTGVREVQSLRIAPRHVPRGMRPRVEALSTNAARTFSLDSAEFYRPTEESWREAGSPVATVVLTRESSGVHVSVTVGLSRATAFAPPCDVNPLDNEPPDVNSDGVQLHWMSPYTGKWNSVIAVPEGNSVRLTAVDGGADEVTASWSALDNGYAVHFRIALPDAHQHFAFNCCVNDRPAGRERRRGQLVVGGAHGESAYLRGARQAEARAVHFVLVPDLS
jgi:hypothetical protein